MNKFEKLITRKKKWDFYFSNYWKTSVDKTGFYFVLFGLAANWHPIGNHHYFSITVLNFEFGFSWEGGRR